MFSMSFKVLQEIKCPLWPPTIIYYFLLNKVQLKSIMLHHNKQNKISLDATRQHPDYCYFVFHYSLYFFWHPATSTYFHLLNPFHCQNTQLFNDITDWIGLIFLICTFILELYMGFIFYYIFSLPIGFSSAVLLWPVSFFDDKLSHFIDFNLSIFSPVFDLVSFPTVSLSLLPVCIVIILIFFHLYCNKF